MDKVIQKSLRSAYKTDHCFKFILQAIVELAGAVDRTLSANLMELSRLTAQWNREMQQDKQNAMRRGPEGRIE